MGGRSDWFKITINFIHRFFWQGMMQVTMAYFTKSACGSNNETREDILADHHKLKETNVNVRCYGILLAHITGFAAINAWGSVQQAKSLPFQTKPWMSLLPVLIMVPVQFGVSQITKSFRNKKMYGDDGKAD